MSLEQVDHTKATFQYFMFWPDICEKQQQFQPFILNIFASFFAFISHKFNKFSVFFYPSV